MGDVRWQSDGENFRWVLSGTIGGTDRRALRRACRAYLLEAARRGAPPRLFIDMEHVNALDDFGRLAILEYLRPVKDEGGKVFFRPTRSPWRWAVAEPWVHLKLVREAERRGSKGQRARPPQKSFFQDLGITAIDYTANVGQAFRFVREILSWTVRAVVFRKARLWQFWDVALRVGVDALPILMVLSFLIGVVMADQGARQLKDFGASVMVADLVTIAFVREMGPLLTAILVAGRSGSAFAATLAAMQDTEEVHALQMMGHHRYGYLVVPRLLATVLCMPVLVLWAIFVGLFGALIYSISPLLDLNPLDYWNRTVSAVEGWDFLLALLKSITFGAIVALVGCYKGMQEVRGADDVGRQTTSSVVWCIFLVIVASTAWTVCFSIFGK